MAPSYRRSGGIVLRFDEDKQRSASVAVSVFDELSICRAGCVRPKAAQIALLAVVVSPRQVTVVVARADRAPLRGPVRRAGEETLFVDGDSAGGPVPSFPAAVAAAVLTREPGVRTPAALGCSLRCAL
jgi:hypothetical protein